MFCKAVLTACVSLPRAVISIGSDGEPVIGLEPDLTRKPDGRLMGADGRGEPVLPGEGGHAVGVDGDKRICSPLTRLTVSRTPLGVSKSVC